RSGPSVSVTSSRAWTNRRSTGVRDMATDVSRAPARRATRARRSRRPVAPRLRRSSAGEIEQAGHALVDAATRAEHDHLDRLGADAERGADLRVAQPAHLHHLQHEPFALA